MQKVKPNNIDMSIGTIVSMALQRKLVIAAFVVISLAIALASLLLLQPRYSASMAMLLEPKGPDTVDTGGEFVSRPVDSLKIGSVVSVIQSNELVDRVVRSEHLTTDPEFQTHVGVIERLLRKLRAIGPEIDEETEASKIATASQILQKKMTVTRDGFTYVIKVDVTSAEAWKARRLAQAIGDAYLNDQLEAKYDSAKHNFKWLSDHLNEMKGELIASEDAVQKLRRTYGLTETDKGSTVTFVSQELAELNKQLVAAQADVSQKQARADFVKALQASRADLESLPEIATSLAVISLKQKRAQAIAKLAELSERYGTNHPEVTRAEREVDAAQADVAAEIKRAVVNLENDYKAAVFRVNSLKLQMAKLAEGEKKSADGLGLLRQAQGVAEANRRLYDSFLTRFKEVEHGRNSQEVEARIISAPRLPKEASFPRPGPFLLMGLGFGLALGLAAAFLLEYRQQSFTTPAQVEHVLDVPVLASVPLLKIGDLTERGKRLSLIEYTAKYPTSRYADSLLSLRLAFDNEPSNRARIVNFASSMPSEGKSSLAACVAISAAMAGCKTILIDCDLRNSSTSRLFQCQELPGLGDVIKGALTLSDVLSPTKVSSLSIIPAGNCVPRPPDLVNSLGLKQLILSAASMADLVIIDSAAIEQVPDAIVPAQIADETVLVVKWHTSDRALTARAVNLLHRAGVKLTGIVLNSVDLKAAPKYGYWSKRYIRETANVAPPKLVGASRSAPPHPNSDEAYHLLGKI